MRWTQRSKVGHGSGGDNRQMAARGKGRARCRPQSGIQKANRLTVELALVHGVANLRAWSLAMPALTK
jgi:hypothetical protein